MISEINLLFDSCCELNECFLRGKDNELREQFNMYESVCFWCDSPQSTVGRSPLDE